MNTVVVKLGGELIAPEKLSEANAIASDLKAISGENRIFVVHGGGPQTSALQTQLGQKPVMIAGRRVTDDAALDAIKMVVAGKLNIDLCSILARAGLRPVGLHGVSGRVIEAEKRPPRVISGGGDAPIDFLHVGDVTGLNEPLLALLSENGYVPVLACVGSDANGRPYNINADVVASAVAGSLRADVLVLVTSAPGVLSNIQDPSTRIAKLSMSEAKASIERGVISGGMIPKVEEAFLALERGARRVLVVGLLREGELARAIRGDDSIGTSFVPD